MINSKSFTGSNIIGTSKLLNETYNGCAVRYFKNIEWGEIAQFSNCVVPEVNSVYTASFWAKGNGKIRAYFHGNQNYLAVLSGTSNQNKVTPFGDGAIDFTITSEWKRYWVTYTLKSSYPTNDTNVAKHFLLRHLQSVTEEEFWVSGYKLEEGSTATPYSQAPEDLGWSTDTLVPTQSNRYLWKFEYVYYSDDSVEVTNPVNLSVAGANGSAGKDGVGLKSTLITYGISTSETTQPSSWSTQVPTLTKGNYLWTKTVWTYTDNTNETGYQKTYIAKDGNDGNDGIAGKDGVGIKSTTITYASSTSGTNKPTSGWSSTIPSVPAGNYLWTKTVWTYTDNTSETGYSVAKMGETGAKGDKGDTGERGPQGIQGLQGPKGDQGIQGQKGADGKTQYTHIAYADNATGGGFSQTDQTKAYIGMYVDFTATDSNDPTKYRWSKWHGDKGATGAQGIQGPKGTDGRTPYLHIAYANSADGRTDFSTSNTDNKRYLGTYTDYTQADSTDPTKYKWVDMVGTVKGGSRNYFKNSLIRTFYTTDGQTFDYRTYIVDEFWKNKDRFKKGFVKISFDITFPVALENDCKTNVHFSAAPWYGSGVTFKAGTTSRQHFELEYDLSGASEDYYTNNVFIRFGTGYGFPSDLKIILENMMLSIGSYYPDYTQAIEDTQEQIDSKADQTLTQEQLNALAEQNSIVKAEMEAKASIDTVNQWVTAYQNYVNANDEAKAESERNLQEAAARILQLKTDVGTLKQQWNFIDTYMTIQNEGLIIGKSDGSAYAKFSNDRISLFSGNSEVMYISQGVLRIENGIFTKTIQIGRFRFETHPADQDILILRYLGG